MASTILYQLARKGWMLSNLGGITHQTISGFVGTGSSGGSTRYSVNDNLWGIRVIDGRGEVHSFSRDDSDPDVFHAFSPNMGLLACSESSRRSRSGARTCSTSPARKR